MYTLSERSHSAATNHSLSVLPARRFVSRLEKVGWNGSIEPQAHADRLPLANEVNTHEYKPAFVRRNGDLLCYVAGPDARAQVEQAWQDSDYGELISRSDTTEIAATQLGDSLTHALHELGRTPSFVLIARVDSFLFAKRLADDLTALGCSHAGRGAPLSNRARDRQNKSTIRVAVQRATSATRTPSCGSVVAQSRLR